MSKFFPYFFKAYLSRPKGDAKLGAIIVIHENRGLVDHIKDVARRFAKDGFVALAPDLLSRVGGSDQYKGGRKRLTRSKMLPTIW